MFNQEAVIELLSRYGIGPEDQTQQLFRILKNKDRAAFAGLELIVPKKVNEFWVKLEEARNKQPEKWIFTRYPVVDRPCSDQKVNAVIYGPCGNGKTHTVNAICGTNYDTKETRESLTREINYNQSIIEKNPPFYLIDTPGTTSSVDKLKHAAFLRKALTWKPLNAVFILVKFENRYEDFFTQLIFESEIVKDYQSKVVFLVTHLDVSKDPKALIASTNEMLDERKSKVQVVFFSNLKCDKKQLRETLYSIAKSLPQSLLTISEKHFLMTFNLTKNEKEALIFSREQNNTLKEMTDIKKIYNDCVNELPNNGEKAQIVQDLAVYLKKELAQIFEGYFKKNIATFVGLEYYTSYFTLQTAISDLCEQFQKDTRSWRKTQFYSADASDIRDLIKQCPNCKLIWYRVEACPSTTCGNRPNSIWDFIKSAFFRYEIIREGGKIRVKGKRQINHGKKQTLENTHNVEKEKVKKFEKIGCGAPMNFASLPRLENIEEIINSWFQTSNNEEAIFKLKEYDKIALNLKQQIYKEVEESVRGCESPRN